MRSREARRGAWCPGSVRAAARAQESFSLLASLTGAALADPGVTAPQEIGPSGARPGIPRAPLQRSRGTYCGRAPRPAPGLACAPLSWALRACASRARPQGGSFPAGFGPLWAPPASSGLQRVEKAGALVRAGEVGQEAGPREGRGLVRGAGPALCSGPLCGPRSQLRVSSTRRSSGVGQEWRARTGQQGALSFRRVPATLARRQEEHCSSGRCSLAPRAPERGPPQPFYTDEKRDLESLPCVPALSTPPGPARTKAGMLGVASGSAVSTDRSGRGSPGSQWPRVRDRGLE